MRSVAYLLAYTWYQMTYVWRQVVIARAWKSGLGEYDKIHSGHTISMLSNENRVYMLPVHSLVDTVWLLESWCKFIILEAAPVIIKLV